MLNTKFAPWPSFQAEELAAATRVLSSNKVNYWTGSEGRSFETEFASFVGVKHAICLANGTVALDLALKALGVGPGDEVIVTPRTFIASVSCVVNAGATPIFADVDPITQNITAQTISQVASKKTKAIICVHLAGLACDMDPIMDLASSIEAYVIEDCAQAHGATYKGRSVGSIGHIGAWSFCQDKIMSTAGEGGMVTTGDSDLWELMWSYKDHGKSWHAVNKKDHKPGFRWLHDHVGTNWRMTEIQAAIGRIQLRNLEGWVATRRRNAQFLWDEANRNSCIEDFDIDETVYSHAAYKAYLFLNSSALKGNWNRDKVVDEISDLGIPCYAGICPEVYREKGISNLGYGPTKRLPVAKMLGETSMMFLVHPGITPENMVEVRDCVNRVLLKAVKP